jgi:hypothetical protein
VSGSGKNFLVALVTIVLSLFACEMTLRAWRSVPVLSTVDFRNLDPNGVKQTVKYDPRLGWVLKDYFNRPDLHTVAYGVRRNSATQIGVRAGHVLAVGASLTEGFQLEDEQTWPAQLEALTGEPVDNAGVVGYGLDQMVLRAEQLLPVERPRLVLLGIGTPNIEWMQSTVMRGASKPFFSVDRNALSLVLPAPETKPNLSKRIKDILGHSALIDFAMSRIDPYGWYPHAASDAKGSFDPVEVSCRLVERLKAELDETGARAIVVVEPQWREVVSGALTPGLDHIIQCARQAGLAIVDTLTAWRADERADPPRVADYWEKTQHRHLTEAGSGRVAVLVAETILTEQRQSEAR